VLELAVTAARRNQIPTIGLNQAEDFGDLHFKRIAGTPKGYSFAQRQAV
jgi:hypothetical protein